MSYKQTFERKNLCVNKEILNEKMHKKANEIKLDF